MADSYFPSPSFLEASTYVANAPSLKKVSNNIKLELYGIFKVLMVASQPDTSRPSLFDLAGRAKWDAWDAAGKSWDGRSGDAENRYLEIAHSLGWVEGATLPPRTSSDDEGGGGMNLMGTSVSKLEKPLADENDAGTIHGFALEDDPKRLAEFLDANPTIDLDQRDEYGYTPLHLATDRGHIAIVRILLERGADIALKDPDDYTALGLAEISENEALVQLLQSKSEQ